MAKGIAMVSPTHRPTWIYVSAGCVVLILLFVAALTFWPRPHEAQSDGFEETLRNAKSSRVHYETLLAMAERMASLGYDRGTVGHPMEMDQVELAGLLVGMQHAHNRTRSSAMEWRLNAYGDDVQPPVSYLTGANHNSAAEVVVEGAVEFGSIVQPIAPALSATALKSINDAAKQLDATPWPSDGYSPRNAWSEILLGGDYGVLTRLIEEPSGKARLLTYFVYIRPGTDVDFSKVTGGGFSFGRNRLQ